MEALTKAQIQSWKNQVAAIANEVDQVLPPNLRNQSQAEAYLKLTEACSNLAAAEVALDLVGILFEVFGNTSNTLKI